jgi:hypothetical protein
MLTTSTRRAQDQGPRNQRSHCLVEPREQSRDNTGCVYWSSRLWARARPEAVVTASLHRQATRGDYEVSTGGQDKAGLAYRFAPSCWEGQRLRGRWVQRAAMDLQLVRAGYILDSTIM